ncbi:MAG: hypothetical protein GX556_07185 [Fibrobacter sp.]|nr:hypothetical protein [Fibrobacter sp.]
MKINYKALLPATVPAILVCILLDAAVEYIFSRFTGISFLTFFEQKLHIQYGIRFYLLNFLLFSAEMFLVICFYAVLRTHFQSPVKPVIICSCFFIGFTYLLLFQMINLGIYPLTPALAFGVSTLVSFPGAVFTGASIYEWQKEETLPLEAK